MKEFRVLVVCGSGIATSTVIANRVKEVLGDNGYSCKVEQRKNTEAAGLASSYDFIVSSTKIPEKLDIPVISALAYLTGVGKQKVDDQILEVARELADK